MKRILFFACIACVSLVIASCSTKNGATDEVTIYGNVIDRTTGLPLYNVLIQEKNKVGGSTATGNDGNYEFTIPLEGSSNGRYYLIASKDKYADSEYELEMDKVDKNRRIKVDFQLTKESITYTGTVVDSKNNPIYDVHISAKMSEPEGYGYSHWYSYGTTAITDANGSYTIELPRPHMYNDDSYKLVNQWKFELTASKDGFADVIHTLNQNADDLGKIIPLNFVMESNSEQFQKNLVTISGKVTNSYGSTISDAYLTVYDNYYSNAYKGSTMTDAYGKFSFSFVPTNTDGHSYKFIMTKTGYNTVTKYLTLSTADKGRTYTLDFTLTK